jgi:hypothetical protein
MQNWVSNQREDDHGEEEKKDEGEEDHQEKEEICARAQSQNQARRGEKTDPQGQGEVEGQGECAQADDACEAVRPARAGAAADDIAGAGSDADRAAAGFVSVVELSARVPDALQRECEA